MQEERPGENLEDMDPAVVEDDQPEPEITLSLAGDADSDSDNLDPDMAQPVGLPTESYQVDESDDHGAEDHPEDS